MFILQEVSKPVILYTFGGYSFIRWIIKVDLILSDKSTAIRYQVKTGKTPLPSQSNIFFVPGAKQAMNFGYNSCNGFHDLTSAPVTGIEPLWSVLIAKQTAMQTAMHLMVSDGDQLYNDAILEDVPELAAVSIRSPILMILHALI